MEVLGITVGRDDGWNDEKAAHQLRMLELIGLGAPVSAVILLLNASSKPPP